MHVCVCVCVYLYTQEGKDNGEGGEKMGRDRQG